MKLKLTEDDVLYINQAPRQAGVNEVENLCDDWNTMHTELAERDQSFDIRWNADMRAIKKWHDAGGDPMTWPDHADLCVWLMERIAHLGRMTAYAHHRDTCELEHFKEVGMQKRCTCGLQEILDMP